MKTSNHTTASFTFSVTSCHEQLALSGMPPPPHQSTQQAVAIDARVERSAASSSSDLSPTIDNLDVPSTFVKLAQSVFATPVPTPEMYNISETSQSTAGPLTTEISQAAPAGQGPSHRNHTKPPAKHDSDKSLNFPWTPEAGDALLCVYKVENEVEISEASPNHQQGLMAVSAKDDSDAGRNDGGSGNRNGWRQPAGKRNREKIETADGLRAIGAGLNSITEALKLLRGKTTGSQTARYYRYSVK
ncbi:unnamed protein product [Phytophthora fragariaefolia]|uniref:Unnamed protein product n=1 Tax=Phytophthora fragariaefolia TaxID=1490495 RepID=A0A9W6Y481_9STRA|nr:unnamed protein product [Phytophthora fragariaefolia]